MLAVRWSGRENADHRPPDTGTEEPLTPVRPDDPADNCMICGRPLQRNEVVRRAQRICSPECAHTWASRS